jgi:hypothetical protein
LRPFVAALAGCAAYGCSASSAVAPEPIGLTCTAPNGAIVRLNLDLARHLFQKEGFPTLPIGAVTPERVVLMDEATSAFAITAVIERGTMDYTATSEDLKSHERTETRYACVSGPMFDVAGVD